MAIRTPGDLKSELETGDKPDGQVFADLIDSLRHKSENIPAGEIDGLVALIAAAVAARTAQDATTNLSITRTGTTITIVSSTGEDAIVPLVSATEAGLIDPDRAKKVDGMDEGATDDQTAAEIADLLAAYDGVGFLPIAAIDGDLGGLGADGKSAYQIWLDNGNQGTEADFLASLRGQPGAAGGSKAFFCFATNGAETIVMATGAQAYHEVQKVADGVVLITVDPTIEAGVSFAIPSEFMGRGGEVATVHLQFAEDHPFYQSEVSLKPPRATLWGRITEDSGGFDVELTGNSNQRRLLPYDEEHPGRVSIQIPGIPTTPFTISIDV